MTHVDVPRLRGVFHQYAFVAAVVAGTLLVVLADGYLERFAVWVYAVALAAMFGASALITASPGAPRPPGFARVGSTTP